MNYILFLSIFTSTIFGFQLSINKQYNLQISKLGQQQEVIDGTSDDVNVFNIGLLSYNDDAKNWGFQVLETEAVNESYCVSLVSEEEEESGLNCFNYKYLEFPLVDQELVIESDENDNENIDSVSLLKITNNNEETKSKSKSNKQNDEKELGLKLSWRKTTVIPNPALKLVKKPAVTGPGGVKLPNSEIDESEKSFIQKYWMYIVPPLVLFVIMGGGSE